MEFEPEIDPDLFDEDFLDELDDELDVPEDYDNHAWDEDSLEEKER